MWSALQWLVVRVAAIRWLFKLGWLGLLVPIVLALKAIGLPILAVLSIAAVPLLILLVLFGFPIFLVLIFGGLIMGFLSFLLTVGLAALKIGIFVVLPIWLMWKLACWIFRRGKGGGGGESTSHGPTSTDTTGHTTSSSASDVSDGFDTA